MMINRKKAKEEPIILLPKHDEEDHRDLSWMIRDDSVVEKPVKKSSKRKKR
jgi:hypothetical protein